MNANQNHHDEIEELNRILGQPASTEVWGDLICNLNNTSDIPLLEEKQSMVRKVLRTWPDDKKVIHAQRQHKFSGLSTLSPYESIVEKGAFDHLYEGRIDQLRHGHIQVIESNHDGSQISFIFNDRSKLILFGLDILTGQFKFVQELDADKVELGHDLNLIHFRTFDQGKKQWLVMRRFGEDIIWKVQLKEGGISIFERKWIVDNQEDESDCSDRFVGCLDEIGEAIYCWIEGENVLYRHCWKDGSTIAKPLEDPIYSMALDVSRRQLLVGEADGAITRFDADTLARVGPSSSIAHLDYPASQVILDDQGRLVCSIHPYCAESWTLNQSQSPRWGGVFWWRHTVKEERYTAVTEFDAAAHTTDQVGGPAQVIQVSDQIAILMAQKYHSYTTGNPILRLMLYHPSQTTQLATFEELIDWSGHDVYTTLSGDGQYLFIAYGKRVLRIHLRLLFEERGLVF